MRIVVLLLPVLLAAHPASAAPIVLDFEGEAAGVRIGEYAPACGCVVLTEERTADPSTGYLVVSDYRGSRVLVVGEEGGILGLALLEPVLALSLDFGGDADPDAGPARLVAFAGDLEVARAELAPNVNNLVDQTLALTSATPFDRAVFTFAQDGDYEPLSPIVDNIVLTPEPAACGFLLVAVAAACARSGAPRARGSWTPGPRRRRPSAVITRAGT